jgi:serine/threonine protein kinase
VLLADTRYWRRGGAHGGGGPEGWEDEEALRNALNASGLDRIGALAFRLGRRSTDDVEEHQLATIAPLPVVGEEGEEVVALSRAGPTSRSPGRNHVLSSPLLGGLSQTLLESPQLLSSSVETAVSTAGRLRRTMSGTLLVKSDPLGLGTSVPSVDFSRVRLGKLLSAGMSGKVHAGEVTLPGRRDRPRGKERGGGDTVEVAVKRFYCTDLTGDVITTFRNEATFLASLQHPNIVGVVGVCVRPPELWLLLEYCPLGSLWDVLQDSPGHASLGWPRRRQFAAGVARSVAFLHSRPQPVAHCDIKSKNFLVAWDWTVKLADLGDAQSAQTGLERERGAADPRRWRWRRVWKAAAAAAVEGGGGGGGLVAAGTPEWMAPEVLGRAMMDISLRAGSLGQLHSMVPGLSERMAAWHAQAGAGDGDQPPGATMQAQQLPPLATRDLLRGDIYSAGVVLWEVACGGVPYATAEPPLRGRLDLVRAVCVADLRPALPADAPAASDAPGWATVEAEARVPYLALLRATWAEPDGRPAASEVLRLVDNLPPLPAVERGGICAECGARGQGGTITCSACSELWAASPDVEERRGAAGPRLDTPLTPATSQSDAREPAAVYRSSTAAE